MAGPKLKTVTRTQGNNKAFKEGAVKPKTFEPEFEEVNPLIAAFRKMVRGSEYDVCELAITTSWDQILFRIDKMLIKITDPSFLNLAARAI